MEHNSPNSWLAGSDPQDSPPLTGESGSNNDEEFDAYGFSLSLANFLSNPTLLVDMLGVNDEAIATFIRQINHPQAKELMLLHNDDGEVFNCIRRYNNETETGIWIQEAAFKFRKPWISSCNWDNCGEKKTEENEEKPPKDYKVYYWTHKTIPNLKFRKYCIEKLHYAVFLVFAEDSYKKQKTTITNEGVGQGHESAPEPVRLPSQNSFQPTQFASTTVETTAAYPYHHYIPVQQTEVAIPAEMHNYAVQNNNNTTSSYNSEQTMQVQVTHADVTQNNTNQMGNCNDQTMPYQQPYIEPQNFPMQNDGALQLDWFQLQVIENTKRSQNNEIEIARLKEEQFKLTAKHVRLEMKTVSNTNNIEDLTDSVAMLEITSQKLIISAIIKILRDNKGTFPAVSKFASKVRELLNDKSITTQEVNRVLNTILEKRGVVKRSTDKSTWILNEEVAKKFDLNNI